MLMPQTFAKWGQQQVAKTPLMQQWTARHWFEAFLDAFTDVQWTVSATSIEMTNWPCRKPNQVLVAKQQVFDDPPMQLQPWMQPLAHDDATGAVVMQFIASVIAGTMHPAPFPDLPDLKPMASKLPYPTNR